jgi:phage terminase Nu1 subunit (DNA packaging protein)
MLNADALVDTEARQLNRRAVDQTLAHIAAARKRADSSDDLIAEGLARPRAYPSSCSGRAA